MKKFLSIVLVLTLLFSLSIPSFSFSKIVGVNILRTQFDHGEGPSDEKGLNIDYSFFSPVSGRDYNKYPLVIFMPGALEGTEESKELYENQFALWACDEFQREFQDAGGAFLMIARSPEDVNITYSWSNERLAEPMKLALDDFIANHPNVDTSRIYGIGWCLGAKGIINLEKVRPGTFSLMSLMVPSFEISKEDAQAISNIDVWFSGSKADTLGLFSAYIEPSWKTLKETAANGRLRIFTTYTKAKNTTLALAHNVWDDASYNWNYLPKNTYAKTTVDQNGKKVSISSYIDFISSFHKDGWEPAKYVAPNAFSLICDCSCHGYSQLRLLIVRLYNRFIKFFAAVLLTDAFMECDCENCGDGLCSQNQCIQTDTTASEAIE